MAMTEGKLVVNSSQGGSAKDTWVLSEEQSIRTQVSLASPIPCSQIYRTKLLQDAGPIMKNVARSSF